MDLGVKREKNEAMPVTSPDVEMPDIIYPSFSLDGDKAKEFADQFPADLNDSMTVKAKIKLTGLRNDKYGSSLNFDILSIDGAKVTSEESGEEGDDTDSERAADGDYTNPAISRLMSRKK